ncbi:MAG TPA: ferredoxin--NADP(+) reductase [Rhodocyclaceae bacterium]|nr:MAG: ferredoxin--NADP(+) reductase [Betaproteobacteria bacterium CG2_30_68_42]PIV74209.1 MAG: ferredoxin--NADP(+) reductase [Rhodocyclales bacterium CG17_big_fil_post_rev_8_21_14_2_50_68_7]PIX74763.1 MAG: ferredoxin--NADP(+) reductase [Rhodocyclales bacterium CG_4_10_14_3_um_filter_68_10]PJA58048.1 MAG: ferredoxin--NADP(+) reductase [Rhodocyclales bacterium CG_4_9_14_3_um_filter_68_10]HCX32528.1 ferredoxin--NADP(+) reductase [Rhodocyclaceae bacterium]
MAERWVEGTVTEKVEWTPQLFSLRVDAPVEAFEAGQFTKLALEIGGEVVGRPYSIVNPPAERPLDFYFGIVKRGHLSLRLAALRAGDRVLVGPRASGFLTLSEVPEGRALWLLATGTGIGPFLSILRTVEPWRRFGRVVLAHAVRTAAERAYVDVIEGIERAHPGAFAFVPFVSREATAFALSGRIPQAIADGRLEERAGAALDPEASRVMLCGNPDMVRDAAAALAARGFRKHRRREPGQILVENYW